MSEELKWKNPALEEMVRRNLYRGHSSLVILFFSFHLSFLAIGMLRCHGSRSTLAAKGHARHVGLPCVGECDSCIMRFRWALMGRESSYGQKPDCDDLSECVWRGHLQPSSYCVAAAGKWPPVWILTRWPAPSFPYSHTWLLILAISSR